jgi:hypothetical protein
MALIVRSHDMLSILAIAAFAALASPPLLAADAASPPDARYLKDRANCESGHTDEDRATCLKEAGAAQVERKHHTLDNNGSMGQNATERCDVLPPKQKVDCMARIDGPSKANQRVTTTGSVAGGGTLTETTTTIPGRITVIPAPAPRASGTAP